MKLVSQVEHDNIVYKIVVQNWGEYQVRIGSQILVCCLATEDEAVEQLNKIISKK